MAPPQTPKVSLVPRDQIERAAVALKSFETKRNPLHDDDDTGIFLGVKRSDVDVHVVSQPKLFAVPHPVMPKQPKICLFMKDFDENDKVAKALFSGLKLLLDKVLVYSRLKKKYSSYDNLRQLASRFDLFLVDERILRAAYTILGKQFAKKAHKPISLKVEGKAFEEITSKIDKIKSSAVYLNANGPTTSTKVALVGFTAAQVVDNVEAALEAIKNKFEKVDNIQHLYIKTPSSPALTIYQIIPEVTEADKKALNEKRQANKNKRAATPETPQTPKTPKTSKASTPQTPKTPKNNNKAQQSTPKPQATEPVKETTTTPPKSAKKAKIDNATQNNTPTPATPKQSNNKTPSKAAPAPAAVAETPKSAKKRTAADMEEQPTTPVAAKQQKKVNTPKQAEATPAKEQKKSEPKQAVTPPAAKKQKQVEASPAPKKEEAKKVETTPAPKKQETKKVATTPVAKEQKKVETTPAPKKQEAKKVETTPAPKKQEAKKAETTPAPKKEEAKKVETTPAPKKQEAKKVGTPVAKEQKKVESKPTPKATPSKKK